MLKFYALVYRLTGWFMPQARLLEYEHIKAHLNEIESRLHEKLKDGYKLSLRSTVGLYVGMWQAKHGFYRPYRKTFKDLPGGSDEE